MDAQTQRRRSSVLLFHAILGAAIASACAPTESPSPIESPTQPSLQPAAPAAPAIPTVSGTVYEWSPLGQRPLGGASVNAWVNLGRSAYSYWFLNGPQYADSEGRFKLGNLPVGATVSLDIHKPGYFQQCAAEFTVQGTSYQLDVHLVPEANLSASPDAAPPAPGGRVRGLVYEVTAQGRRPVAKAYVLYMAGPDFDTATTVTDGDGRFFLCGLSQSRSISVLSSAGAYREAFITLPPGDDVTVEIELK